MTVSLRLIKTAKVALLLAISVQTLMPFEIFPIADDGLPVRALGVVAYTLGLLMAVAGRLQLGNNWSDIEDPNVGGAQSVVSRGLYQYVRHPIYVGDLLLLVGLELALNCWLVLAVLVLVPFVLRRAILEEKILAARLPGYEEYIRRTKRFIPFVA